MSPLGYYCSWYCGTLDTWVWLYTIIETDFVSSLISACSYVPPVYSRWAAPFLRQDPAHRNLNLLPSLPVLCWMPSQIWFCHIVFLKISVVLQGSRRCWALWPISRKRFSASVLKGTTTTGNHSCCGPCSLCRHKCTVYHLVGGWLQCLQLLHLCSPMRSSQSRITKGIAALRGTAPRNQVSSMLTFTGWIYLRSRAIR